MNQQFFSKLHLDGFRKRYCEKSDKNFFYVENQLDMLKNATLPNLIFTKIDSEVLCISKYHIFRRYTDGSNFEKDHFRHYSATFGYGSYSAAIEGGNLCDFNASWLIFDILGGKLEYNQVRDFGLFKDELSRQIHGRMEESAKFWPFEN